MATRARMLSDLETPPRVSKTASRNSTSKKRKRRKSAALPTEQRKPDASPRSTGERASTAKRRAREDQLFPIVGIGASAGGLEALDGLLRNLPDTSGLAFIVVQHLDPTHKGMMVELLQRATPMKVVQIRDRQRVEPNRVYVIPPNKDIS
ncbi:MAG TPA: chemotaxis protein CheB, partial [Polyangiaceae bacterium]|nr:chemotaxis protein CheB [Polyangiaceae bacterium]